MVVFPSALLVQSVWKPKYQNMVGYIAAVSLSWVMCNLETPVKRSKAAALHWLVFPELSKKPAAVIDGPLEPSRQPCDTWELVVSRMTCDNLSLLTLLGHEVGR